MYKIVFLLCCLSVAVFAYDFKDSDYNEYLMQDLIDISGDDGEKILSRFRNRRDTEEMVECKPKKNSMTRCCNDHADEDAEIHQNRYKDLRKQCFKEIKGNQKDEAIDMFSCQTVNQTKDDFICMSQCVGQKVKIVDDDGNLIDDAVKNYVKNELTYVQWQKELADEISEKCIREANDAKNDVSSKCKSASLKLGHCLWREYTRSCPKEFQNDSAKCTKLRSKLDNGAKYDFGSYHRYHSDSEDVDN